MELSDGVIEWGGVGADGGAAKPLLNQMLALGGGTGRTGGTITERTSARGSCQGTFESAVGVGRRNGEEGEV